MGGISTEQIVNELKEVKDNLLLLIEGGSSASEMVSKQLSPLQNQLERILSMPSEEIINNLKDEETIERKLDKQIGELEGFGGLKGLRTRIEQMQRNSELQSKLKGLDRQLEEYGATVTQINIKIQNDRKCLGSKRTRVNELVQRQTILKQKENEFNNELKKYEKKDKEETDIFKQLAQVAQDMKKSYKEIQRLYGV